MRAPARHGWIVDLAALTICALTTIWLCWPGLQTAAFHNQDVAGITYNADLILAGQVPYHSNLEFKAPGSFFLTAFAWTVGGRSLTTLQWAACLWSILGAFGVFVVGRLLYDRLAGALAAGLYVVYAANIGSMDANYGVWMATPAIWATAACVQALRTGRLRMWLICGIALALAGLCKRQAAALFPVFLAVLLWRKLERPTGWAPPVARLRGSAALLGGLAIGFGALGIWYLAKGGAEAYIRHYFFSESGWQYAAQTELDLNEKLARVGDGLLGFWEYVGGPTLLALPVMLLAGWRRRLTVRGVLLAGHLALSFAGTAVGFRFFKSYYQQVLPALCWLAAHPDGPLARALDPALWRARRAQAALALGLVVAVAIPTGRKAFIEYGRVERLRAHNAEQDVQRIGRTIQANSSPTDTIWVWGRWAWPVYFHTERFSATRYYKVLGVVTNTLTNTWRRPTQPTRFVQTPVADEIIADLRRARPAFIVLSKNEQHAGWTAFTQLLREEYRIVPHFKMKRFVTYHRKDHPLAKPPRPHARSRKKTP